MRLSTMWRVDRIVASDGTNPVATALAAPWKPDGAPVFFRSSANFVYTVERAGRPCFLRFAASSEGASVERVAAELAAMGRVRTRGIATPVPLLTSAGEAISVNEAGGTTYVAVMLSRARGRADRRGRR